MKIRRTGLIPVLLFAGALAAQADNSGIYREKILPVLNAHCSSCHAGASPQAGLAVSSFESVLTGGKRGHALVPGNARDSPLIQFLRGEKSPRMPLGGALPDTVIDGIAAAIDEMRPAVIAGDPDAAWLLRKPKLETAPAVKNAAWVKNPIDAFVLARLEAKGLSPGPPADRRALIRRLYFDLIGLPPAPEEIQQFQSDPSPVAYEKLIDTLLADTRYGERWARHWLDLARFAETDGFAIDGERPTAWRYRDYVIRSFNKDKPYDLFVKEQLAGDELNDKRAVPEDRSERLVAMGFLRMATWEADANFKTQLRQDFLNEVTGTTASVFLGLTVGCARCHDHKYDPIPQRDFYRMQSFFAATRVEERPAPFLKIENPHGMKQLQRQYEDEAEIAGEEFSKLEAALKQKTKGDFAKAIKDKKDVTYSDEERKSYEGARNRARRVNEAALRYRPVAYSVSDVVPPQVPAVAETFVLAGGELAGRGEKVDPGFPQCVVGKAEDAKIPFAGGSSGRREALAEWIASPDNPLTARVMVNRIWQHHFGEGLVRTPNDFGKNGDKPSHPELLDWLAARFVERKWSIKGMHKLMLLSNTYQQSTGHPEWKQYAKVDPDNRLLWRMNWLRLDSEVLRDSILAASGRLEKTAGGPGVFFNISQDVADGFEFFKWFPSDEKEQLRRTIYAFQRRSVMMPLMEVFDGANMSESCSRRQITTVAPQAFTLLNGELTNTEAKHFAARVMELAGPDRERQIDKAFHFALGRSPSIREKNEAGGIPLERLAAVLFNLNEFLYLE